VPRPAAGETGKTGFPCSGHFAAARQKKARTAKKAEIKRQILKRISIFADGKFEDGGVKYNKWTA